MGNYGKGTNVCLQAIKCLDADMSSRSILNNFIVSTFFRTRVGLEFTRENPIQSGIFNMWILV